MPVSGGIKTFELAYLLFEDDPRERLEFQHLPQELSWSKSADYASIPIIGRSEPVRVYSSSSARTISLQLDFVASATRDDDGDADTIRERVRWCESLVYPILDGDIIKPPPVLILVVGDILNMRCVCSSVSPMVRDPWTTDLNPLISSISLTLEEVNEIPPVSSDIRL